MKLALVNPSDGFNKECIPLGLAYLSAYLKEHIPDIEITLLDANCQDIYKEYDPNTQVVAITAVTQDIDKAIQFAEFVRASNLFVPLILGGVHITTYRVLPEPFNVGIIGEGEETLLELLQPDGDVKNVRGVCYNDNGETIFTEPRPLIEPLDKIPMPDRDIADISYYTQPRHIIPYYSGRTLTMMTSRGCPFNCVFCSTKVHWKKFRAFSAERVIQEIEYLIEKYNVEIIHIFDDLFIADRKRFAEIHKAILERGIDSKVKFMCLVRSDLIDSKTMKMLKEMNVAVIGIGMESGNPKTLEYLKKNTTTIEKNKKAIELANRYGIPVMGSFMLGNPYETEEELLQTYDFIKGYRYSPYLAPLSYIATAFPGTQFWEYAKKRGVGVNWDAIQMDIPKDITPLHDAPLLTDIPIGRFYEILKLFDIEAKYGIIKQDIFLPGGSILKAYAKATLIEGNPFTAITEVNKIRDGFKRYQKMQWFEPAHGTIKYNTILHDAERDQYSGVVRQMFEYAPWMMKRKIPRANVQQAFVMDTVHRLASDMISPKILCVGCYEDTAYESLKAIGYDVVGIDPEVNMDLTTFISQHETDLESFDIVFSTSVLEHVKDDEEFIKDIAALLKVGGVAILTCDFNNSYKPGDKLPATDMRFYTKNDLSNRLVKFMDGCVFLDTPDWNSTLNDFSNEGCDYTFATMVFHKIWKTKIAIAKPEIIIDYLCPHCGSHEKVSIPDIEKRFPKGSSWVCHDCRGIADFWKNSITLK